MDNPEKYISGLLRIHDCVIVPDFGGFVLNETPSAFSGRLNELVPRGKKPSFNRNLTLNDGLLANYIANAENVSYPESLAHIKNAVEVWKKKLQNRESLHFRGLGSLAQNQENKIVFEPETGADYLKASYGLYPLLLSPVEKTQGQQKIFALPSTQKRKPDQPNRKIGRGVAITAVAASFLLAFVFTYNNLPNKIALLSGSGNTSGSSQSVHSSIKPIAASIGSIIDNATEKPVQQIQAPDTLAVVSPNFYVVGGSFKVEANAKKFVSALKEKGFKAQILDNDDGWFHVSYLTEQDSLKADKDLHSIKINENQSAWILKF